MKKGITKILCPYDGTESSERAFNYVLNLAKTLNSKILLLTCIKDQATFGFFKLKSDKKLINKQKENVKKKIEKLKKQAKETGICISSKIIKCDFISKEIVDYARKEKVDIITMSRTKHGTVAEKMYSESTVENVFRDAPCTFLHVK